MRGLRKPCAAYFRGECHVYSLESIGRGGIHFIYRSTEKSLPLEIHVTCVHTPAQHVSMPRYISTLFSRPYATISPLANHTHARYHHANDATELVDTISQLFCSSSSQHQSPGTSVRGRAPPGRRRALMRTQRAAHASTATGFARRAMSAVTPAHPALHGSYTPAVCSARAATAARFTAQMPPRSSGNRYQLNHREAGRFDP